MYRYITIVHNFVLLLILSMYIHYTYSNGAHLFQRIYNESLPYGLYYALETRKSSSQNNCVDAISSL